MSRRAPSLAGPILLLAGLAGPAGLAADRSAPAVAILPLGASVEVLGGTRPVDGDSMRPPTFAWHSSRDGAGQWGALRPLEPPASGLPFALRGSPWRLETAGFHRGESLHHRLLPLSAELGLAGGRIEPLADVARLRVASVDAWTIVVAEQAAGGEILLRRITAEGSSLEMNVAEQFDWPTGWPEKTTLIDIDANEDKVFSWGRDASGSIHVSTLPPSAVPSLHLPPDALVAGVLLREGPAVVALAVGTLQLHVLGREGWLAGDAMPWIKASAAREPRELVARVGGEDRGLLIVAVAEHLASENEAPSLTVATRDAQGWSLPVRLAIAEEPPPRRESWIGMGPGSRPSTGLAHRAILAGAALTALVALAVLISQVKALRRRQGERPD